MPTALLALTLLTFASPRIAVKARAHVEGLKAQSDGRTVHVRGVLRDNLGQPLPRQPISVVAGEVRQAARTDAQGKFDVRIRVTSDGQQAVRVEYSGNPLVSAATQEKTISVGRGAVAIRVHMPPTIEAEQGLTISADVVDAENQPLPGLALMIRLGDTAQEPVRVGPDGRALIALPPLQPGPHTLRVRYRGDDDHLPADDAVDFEAARSMGVTLRVAHANPAPRQPLVFSGRVEGPGGATVRLLVDGAPLKETRAQADGGFSLVVSADAIGAGTHRVRAGAVTDESGWRDGLSEPVTVTVPPPPPPSPWWLWAPAILAAISAIGVLGRAWRRRPRPKAAPLPPVVEAPPAFTFEPSAKGSRLALQVTLRDGLSGRPLQGTLVLLAPLEPTPGRAQFEPPAGLQIQTDAQGQASLDGQGDRLWAWAEGYAPAWHALPSSGGFAGVNLLPIRARLQIIYAEVLTAAGRPTLRFGKQTPREAAPPLAVRGAPDDPLSALTALVEQACFGAAAPTQADLAKADRLALAIEAGLGRRA
ncbi:MAG: hypothetical protein ACI9U2_003831 [Bradymonadia bacterium]|jgi:hypothetical protein